MTLLRYIGNEFFSSVTVFGHPVFYILLILLIVKFQLALVLPLAFGLALIEIICIIIKLLYKKRRPIPQAEQRWFLRIDAQSFPSVHSARAAFLAFGALAVDATVASFVFCVGLALRVGYSRIYLKKHYVLDIISGFALGIIIVGPIFYFT